MEDNTSVLISQTARYLEIRASESNTVKPHVICSDFISVQALHLAQALLLELITSSRKDFVFHGAGKGHSPVDPRGRGSGLIKAFQAL